MRLVALDFKGAFDKVWWRGLLVHLWAVGVRSKAFKLMQSYLSNRALFVVANGDSSSHMSIKSEVLQGPSGRLYCLTSPFAMSHSESGKLFYYASSTTLMTSPSRRT